MASYDSAVPMSWRADRSKDRTQPAATTSSRLFTDFFEQKGRSFLPG